MRIHRFRKPKMKHRHWWGWHDWFREFDEVRMVSSLSHCGERCSLALFGRTWWLCKLLLLWCMNTVCISKLQTVDCNKIWAVLFRVISSGWFCTWVDMIWVGNYTWEKYLYCRDFCSGLKNFGAGVSVAVCCNCWVRHVADIHTCWALSVLTTCWKFLR